MLRFIIVIFRSSQSCPSLRYKELLPFQLKKNLKGIIIMARKHNLVQQKLSHMEILLLREHYSYSVLALSINVAMYTKHMKILLCCNTKPSLCI